METAKLSESIILGHRLTSKEALSLVTVDLEELLKAANAVRQHFHSNNVHLCSIINAKSGNCAEDCKFCAQSAHHSSEVKTYPLVAKDTILAGYAQARANGAHGYSIVTSGNQLSIDEIDTLCDTVALLPKTDSPYICGSLGRLTTADIARLKSAGLGKAHHNLETSRRFFAKICTTHSYDQRLETVRNLKKAGLRVCSGGIFGIGEDWADRIDLAFTMRELDVESIPLNFLIPVEGTRLESSNLLTPNDALRIIALYRLILPDKDIRVCAGREKVLSDIQDRIFYAGATGMMIGGYLTQPGRDVQEDIAMLDKLGMEYGATDYTD
ncbi:MAG: biotin synthase BioB [Planctomycetes bacterium]|nr:biotin synthase BioB [Planctomycetota bacterium]